MGESVKALLGLSVIVGFIGSFLVVLVPPINWPAVAGLLSIGAGSSGILLWSRSRADKVPDFLDELPGSAFERNGLCFKLFLTTAERCCYLELYSQAHYERPSRPNIQLRPSNGYFKGTSPMPLTSTVINCPAGGYTKATFPWPVPAEFQGTTQSLDVLADVRYSHGKGRMIRYRSGIPVGPAAVDHFWTIIKLLGALTLTWVHHTPARLQLVLPSNVDDTVDYTPRITREVFWELTETAPHPSYEKGLIFEDEF